MKCFINLVIFTCVFACNNVLAQMDMLLSSLDIQYCDTLPERFVMDDWGIPQDSEWKTIPLTRDIETKYFNPLISRAGYDYSYYEEGDLSPMVILQAYKHQDRKYLLYATGNFGRSYYLADISDGNIYPPTLLVHYAEGGMANVIYKFDSISNTIIISCINENKGLRVDMKYSLDKGFMPIGNTFYKKRGEQEINDQATIWCVISESEWQKSLFPPTVDSRSMDLSSIKSLNTLPDSLPIQNVGFVHSGTLIPIETVQNNLIPILNLTEYINRQRKCDILSYYALSIINGKNGKFLLYLSKSSNEINVMLADLSNQTTYPPTLVLQRIDQANNKGISIFYRFDKTTNCIEINSISQFADNKPICLREHYSLEPGFTYRGNQTFEYVDDLDDNQVFTPLDESKWIEIILNPELRIHGD